MSGRRDLERDELMRGLDTEQLLADWFHEEAPKQEPPILLPATLARTAMTRQRSKWLTRDWWLGLLGLTDRRPPTMLVSIGFVAVLTSLTLLALLVVAPGQSDEQIPPPDSALIVAQDGSGDFETIEEAIAGAADGDIVFIKPGEYIAAVRTETSVTFLGGAADRADVVIRVAPSAQQAFELQDATVRFERLSIAPDTSGRPGVRGVHLLNGTVESSVELADVALAGFDDGCALETSLVGDQIWGGVEHGIDVTVSESSFGDGTTGICAEVLDSLRVEDSDFSGLRTAVEAVGSIEIIGSRFEGNDTALSTDGDLRLTGNRFVGNREAVVTGGGSLDSEQVIVGNEFVDSATALSLGFGGYDVRDNTITGGDTGLRLDNRRRGSVTGNAFDDVGGIAIEALEARGTLEGNTITGGGRGIAVEGGVPDVLENRIDGVDGAAITVGSGTRGSVVGNELCGNGADIEVAQDAETVVSENSTCEGQG